MLNQTSLVVIGADIWDPSFTDWLFAEATKPLGTAPSPPAAPVKTSDPSPPPVPEPLPIPTFVDERSRDELAHPGRRLQPGGARIYNQAVSGAQKRTASMRSPSPQGGPNKIPRRNDLPSGPRAMMREDGGNDGGRGERRDRPRSLRDRMGGFANGTNNLGPNGPMNGPPPNMMMGPGGFIGPMGPMPGPMGMMGMDPSNNQGALAEALMAQNQLLQNMMSMMQGGMMPNMQGMPGPMGPNGPNGPPMPPNGHGQGPQRGRGRGRGGRGGPPADGGHQAIPSGPNNPISTKPAALQPVPPAIQAPQPKPAVPAPAPTELPNRPLSPTLCKFGVNCTNSLCRYSHPSAAATQESGIVLSTEACPEGRFCKDKDCKLSHPSSATGAPKPAFPTSRSFTDLLVPGPPPAAPAPAVQHHSTTVACKFGANCTRPGCTFAHPPKPRSTIPCKFGVNCTRPDCMFTHPPKGWTPTGGGAGSISVRFNPDAKPFVPKGAAAPVILDTSSQPSSPTEATKPLKSGDELAAAPAAEEQKGAELVAAV